MFFLIYYVLTKRNTTFKLGVSRALKWRSQQPKAGAVSWPIPFTLKLQWSAVRVSCPLGGLRTKCLKDCSNSKCCYKIFSTWIWPNQLGCPRMVRTSKLLKEIKTIINFEPALPLLHYPIKIVTLPKWCCSQTDSYAVHTLRFLACAWGLEWQTWSPVFPISPHSSPLQHGRIRWLVTRQFLCAIQVLSCQEF